VVKKSYLIEYCVKQIISLQNIISLSFQLSQN
jgi:hypothetical protein